MLVEPACIERFGCLKEIGKGTSLALRDLSGKWTLRRNFIAQKRSLVSIRSGRLLRQLHCHLNVEPLRILKSAWP